MTKSNRVSKSVHTSHFDRIKNNFILRGWNTLHIRGYLEAKNGIGDEYSISVEGNSWTFRWVEKNLERVVKLEFEEDVCVYGEKHIGKSIDEITAAFISYLMQFRIISRQRELLFF
jgi:hypothetical protein